MSDKIIVKTFFGLEELLAGEIKAIGGKNIEIVNRAVVFEGGIRELYKANYLCRTALRVLQVIAVFEVKNQEDLYRQIGRIDWDKYFSANNTFAVDSTINQTETFNNSMFVSVKAKDAIVDKFRAKTGIRPNVDRDHPDIRVNIHIFKEQCTVSLDSSGTSLHMRGYRAEVTKAPIKETLAAGLIMLTGWDSSRPFIDPMCGSGTFSIEAAMIAQNIPAGYYRKEFGFEKWNSFDANLWEEIILEAEDKIDDKIKVNIIASDKAKKSFEIAKANMKEAQLRNTITLLNKPFEELDFPKDNAVVIFNPPYGERMDKDDDIFAFYKNIGNTLKQRYKGCEAWIISSNLQALKQVGLHPSKKIVVYNGSLECRFVKFELYEGSKRMKSELNEQNTNVDDAQ